MALAESKITSEGQISVPDEVWRKSGVGPGTVLIWEEDGDKIVVTRAKKYTSEDIRKALFPDGPPPRRSIEEMDEGTRDYMRKKHARGRY